MSSIMKETTFKKLIKEDKEENLFEKILHIIIQIFIVKQSLIIIFKFIYPKINYLLYSFL